VPHRSPPCCVLERWLSVCDRMFLWGLVRFELICGSGCVGKFLCSEVEWVDLLERRLGLTSCHSLLVVFVAL